MNATLELRDGFKGTVKSGAGSKLRCVIEAPDTETNRAFLLNCLFTLQSRRYSLASLEVAGGFQPDKRGKHFPLVKVERPTIGPHHGENMGQRQYACFTIMEDRYDGFPLLDTFGATREDLETALRVEACLNRHSSVPTADILALPHAADVDIADRILYRTVADVLAGTCDLEELRAAFDEARRYSDPFEADRLSPPDPLKSLSFLTGDDPPPGLRYIPPPPPEPRVAVPVPGTICGYCGGNPDDKYKPCPFRGYRPGECFKLTGIQPDRNAIR